LAWILFDQIILRDHMLK